MCLSILNRHLTPLDLYQKNPLTLRKLLAKRQNPCTQIFKCQQLSNATNQSKTKLNLQSKVITGSPLHSTISAPPQNIQNSQFKPQQHLFNKNLSSNIKRPDVIEIESEDEEPDSIEKIQKKIKASPPATEPNSRKVSYDDEKEVSDHSTTCENHSEGSPVVEIVDTLWSPVLNFKNCKDPAILILDEEEAKNDISSPLDNFSVFRKAQLLAERLGGKCLSSTCLLSDKLRFRCRLRHQWEMSMADLGHKWCPKCESLLKKCKSFAQSFGGVCLNETFEETLNFVCCQGHQWGVNHKKFESSWCPECQQQEKELFKKKCEEERKRREKAQEEYQQKLFEEARRKAMQGSCSQPQTSAEDFLAYFQKADLEVEAVAKKDAEEYMAHKDMSENVSFQQALQVYKILIMPEDILEKYM